MGIVKICVVECGEMVEIVRVSGGLCCECVG